MATTPNLQRKLQQALGAEAAGDLGAWMQSMDAHCMEIRELRREMQVGFAKMDDRLAMMDDRFARIDERFARVDGRMDSLQASFDGRTDALQARFDGRLDAVAERFEATLEKGLREQTRFFFLAWSVLLAAMIGLYARPA